MQLNVEQLANSNAVIVTIDNATLDASETKLFKEKIQPTLGSHATVLLDMSKLSFVDSSGLGCCCFVCAQ